MESPLTHRSMSSARISTNASTGSLDIELLVDTPLVHSLMSESITICSLPSICSGDLPAFGPCKLPTWRMIGLGDRLKMFSSLERPLSHNGKTRNGNVAISIPTSPRLKTMLKECLSISKWAESSTAWQPPGHVPWESVHDNTSPSWVPEGSLFSPERFSTALLRSRYSRRGIQTRPHAESPSSSISSRSAAVATQTPPCTRQNSIDAELLSMMQELKSIRSFFQDSDSIDEIAQETLSVPSLVISNSEFTFPMALESSSSIRQVRSNSLASRRGQKVPPTLLLRKGRSTTDLSYPGIPTAFLGSPSRYTPKFEEANKEEKPSLQFEEMINNLRLQCSTMALQTPPTDPSLNSRSSPESESKSSKQEADRDEWSFANELIKEHKHPTPQIPRPKTLQTHRRANSHGTRITKKNSPVVVPKTTKLSKANEKQSVPKNPISAGCASGDPPSKPVPNKTCPPEPLRSAIAKFDSSRTLRSFKSVRFFLPRQDLLKEAAAPVLHEEVAPKVETPLLSNIPSTTTTAESTGPISQTKSKDLIGESPAPALSRKTSKIARVLVNSPLGRVRDAERSTATTTASPSPRQPSIPSSASEGPKTTLTKSSSRMSVHSLGRHSLGRIIKGPLFTSKDKRATLSSIPFTPASENAVRREGDVAPPISKKSRMPVPLRNIFTRFK